MVSALYIIVLTATCAVLADAVTDYCNLRTCNGPEHTLCKYRFLRVNQRQCGRVESSSLTQEEIQEILNAHNNYRALVASGLERRGPNGPQPAATNLGPLSWDQELADIAQTWANQCKYGHDQCRNSQRFHVGQNIAYIGSTGGYNVKWSDLVKDWYDEVALFDRNQVQSFVFWKKIAHYTQMMWAKTTVLGCGGVRYNPNGRWNKTYLVCNYGPTGNLPSKEIYKTR